MVYKQKTFLKDVEEGYDLVADNYKNFWKQLDNYDKGEFLRFIPRSLEDKVILDIGAGDGRIYNLLKNKKFKEFIAYDISQKMLDKHPNGKNIKKIKGNLEKNLEFENESIDLIISFFVLEHIKNIENLLENICNILKKSGTFIIGHFIQRRAYIHEKGKLKFKINRFNYSAKQLKNILENNGLNVFFLPIFENKNKIGDLLIGKK